MDISRAEKIAEVIKSTTQLGKNIKRTITPAAQSALGALSAQSAKLRLPTAPVEGTGLLMILMYCVAGLFVIGLLLLAIDQWITPVFQRVPGGRGYIPIPGTDVSEVYWVSPNTVDDITIGGTSKLSTSSIEGQASYSITMDVFISDESPQEIGPDDKRVLFVLGQTPTTPSIMVWLANDRNTAYVTAYDKDGLQQSAALENVPIHTTFRIGIVKTPYVMEAYLNGKLVTTRQLRTSTKLPTTGDKIFAPANLISADGRVLSQNIKVLKVRLMGYPATPSEMSGRMSDLTADTIFRPSDK